MANKALIVGSAGVQEVTNAGTVQIGAGIDTSTATTLSVGTSTATAITIGKAGVTTSFPGPVSLTGDVTTVGGTQFTTDAQFDGNITLGSDATDNISFLGQVSTAITQEGIAAPAVSPASTGRLYFDSTANKFRMSQNGGAYTDVGTVTSVSFQTTLSGLTATPTPITGSGTIQLVGTLGTASGGTGLTSLSAGGILVGNGPGNNVFVVDSVASGRVLLSNGVGFFPIWGQVDLTTAVTNALPVTNGGTGLAVVPAGNLLIGNTASQLSLRAPGTAGNVLTSNGTTWTSAAPSVSASGTATQLAYFTAASTLGSETAVGADALTWDATNNRLGVRTSAPTRALEVSGDDALINTVRIGLGAGAIATNTALGTAALNTNTTGELNTAVGRNTLFSNSTGTELTAVGYNALTSNTASFNTAVGTGALEDNTTGTRNTAMGRRSMANSVAGSDNTAVGYQSLLLMNGGANNTAVGSSAADAITTGANSVAVGSGALGAVTTGNDNTALGASALLTLAGAGSQSTAVGASAQQNATVGGSTAVGYQAGLLLGGLRSTAIGNQAMGSTSSNGGEDSVAVGHQAHNGGSGTQNVAVGALAMTSPGAGSRSVAVGYAALQTAQGNQNVGIGVSAGQSLSTANDSVAIGYAALQSITGNQNVSIGSGSMGGVSGAFSDNTAVGYNALRNTAVNQITAVGSGALDALTSGTANVAVGYNALGSVTTGTSCTAVGHSALSASTGSSNTAVGARALTANTSGSNLIAIGDDSLRQNTTGGSNVAIGPLALFANVSNSRCVGIGTSALVNSTNNDNTAVGWSAGSTISTGSNITCIGANAQPSSGLTTNEFTLGSGVTTLRCGTGTITVISDARDKADIQDLSLGLDFLATVHPVQFKWDRREWYDGGVSDGSKKQDVFEPGFIAQELDAAQTAANVEWMGLALKNNPDRLEATPLRLFPVVVKAAQELAAKVAAAEARADAAEARLAALEAAVAALQAK